jgi:hypothetical protein
VPESFLGALPVGILPKPSKQKISRSDSSARKLAFADFKTFFVKPGIAQITAAAKFDQ